MTELFIEQRHLKMLLDIVNSYCPKAEIWCYGSRTDGTAHEGSDLDLTVKNWGDEKCSLSELKQLLIDSNIPFLIDINEYSKLPESFKNEIDLNHILLNSELLINK